jgi:hypothetical protein
MNVLRWGTLLSWYAWSEFYSLSVGFLQSWAKAMKSQLYLGALIFCDKNKDLIVIGTFCFNGALIS